MEMRDAENPKSGLQEGGFSEFWNLYPRRVAKRDAENAWKRMSASDRFAAIQSLPIHIRYWNLCGTGKEFLPYPATWLNGRRWEDELEMPETKDEWWKTQEGIERKAREVGCWPARAHEGWHELKARILATINKAA